MERNALIDRRTRETEIRIALNLDGRGVSEITTGIPFLNHMLTSMAVHGFLDLEVSAKGDTEVDFHHTVEDLGICLGMAIREAVGDKKGLRRYGQASVPMDEALASVVIDISNRPFLAYRVTLKESRAGNFDVRLLEEFFRALASYSGITMHVDLLSGNDAHHVAESIFKAFGRALDQAVRIDERLGGSVPSTKGVL